MKRLSLVVATSLIVVALAANAAVGFLLVKEKQTNREITQSLKAEQLRNTELTQDKTKLTGELKDVSVKLTTTEKELATKLDELKKTQSEITAKKKEIDSLSSKIKNQESQLAANSAELDKLRSRPPLFLVENKSSIAGGETAISELRQVVEAAFDEIKVLYGDAYLLNQVTVQLVDSLSRPNVAGEITIQNSKEGLKYTIKIKKFSKNNMLDVTTIVHEIIHAFHGIAFLEPVAYEEGITVAATEEIVSFLISRGLVPNFSSRYLNISAERETELEQDPNFVIPASTDAFYGSDQTAEFYQMTGRAWQKLAGGDRGFYKRFNEALYAKVRAGTDPRGQVVLDTIREVKGSVPAKKAFNPV